MSLDLNIDSPLTSTSQLQSKPEASKAIENIDTLDSLDDLEKTFQNVISELVADKSLDSFRTEYENVHSAFLKSHSNNAELVKKCRDLNSEILANSTKVNSILQLSQDDQRTIAGLRFEFDKAWKLVEVSQEKENKSRDVIDQLKAEVSKLSKLVETAGTIALTQETSIQGIQDEVTGLQKEIKLQNAQIQSLQNDYESSISKQKEINCKISSLKEEQEKLEIQLEEQREIQKSLDEETKMKSKEMNELKNECKVNQEEAETFNKRNAESKQNNEFLSQRLSDENKSIRELNEIKKDQIARVNVVQKVLEDKKKLGQRLIDQQEAIKNKTQIKESKKSAHMKNLSELTQKNENLTDELSQIKIEKDKLQNSLNETHKTISDLRGEIYNLTHEVIRKESLIEGTNRSISLLQLQNTKSKNEVFDERKKCQTVESQTDGIENEILGAKAEAKQIRMKLESVKTEIERYSRISSDNRSNLIVAESDRKMREEEIKQLDKTLRDFKNQISKQNNLSETILQQRDLLRQQVEVLQKDCKKIDDDNKILLNEIHSMKEIIRQKDTECVSAHLQKNQIQNSFAELNVESAKLENGLKEAIQNQCTLENKLMRARYLRDIALTDLSNLRRANEKIESDFRLLELSINSKSVESTKLKDKCRVLTSTITTTAQTYSALTKKVEESKNELSCEMKKIEELRNKTQHTGLLKLELIRLEKAKLQAQGKARALEDELETPMMIHRWRFLEGTNPEMANLIKMTHALRGKMMLKLSALSRYRACVKEWEEKLKSQQAHIRQTTISEHKETIKFFESILRQKSQQLEMLSSQISGQKENVEDSKSNVESIRQQLRDTKTEFFNEKKMTEKLRASSQINRTNLPQQSQNNTQNRYIGGGFAVSQLAVQKPLHFSQSPKTISNMGNAIITPIIKTGAMATNGPKQIKSLTMVQGWNPNRKPLQPLLPTVSEIC